MNFLKGYKTYILAAAALGVVGLNLMGYIDTPTANTILTVLGFGSIITLRNAI